MYVNSSFIAKWLESYYKDYRPSNWLHNVSYRPLRLLTDKDNDVCYNVHVDNAICVDPGWGSRRAWLKQDGVKWRTKMAAHYFGIPNDGEGLLNISFSLAELIKYVNKALLNSMGIVNKLCRIHVLCLVINFFK